MRNILLIWKFMKGNRLLYIGAIIAIGLATVSSMISPLVIRTTIDSIIGNEPIELPEPAISLINGLGGRSVLSGNLWICGIALVLLNVINGVFLFLKGKWTATASESTARNIRNKLYDHIQNQPYDRHVKAKTGDLIQRCTSDVETVRNFLASQFIEVGRSLFMVAIVSVIMFSIDVRMTLVSMAALPAIFIFAVIFFMKVKRTFLESDEAEGRLSTVLQENLTGVRVVRAFAQQAYEIEKFDRINREFRDLTYRLMKLLAWYWSFSDGMCLLQMGAILVLGCYWAAAGSITLGTLVVFTTYEGMLLWPVRNMGRILADMGKTMVSAGRIQEILDQPEEDMQEEGLRPQISGNIEFRNVSFKYEGNSEALRNVSFDVKKGQTVAIMGPTGSGKTTLVNLLLRLYDYNEGSIRIDGYELKDIDKRWLRRNIGIVAQETFLYSKTIKENIKIAAENARDEEVFTAARTACVHDVILGFDKGYDTAVGEKGITLSGGQKQRVSIARTIINKYPVLIFDDSLSAVDTETDAAIRKALKERSRDITTFIISHRVTTLAECDQILVLDKGELVQRGTHEELISQEGIYKRVWSIQNSLEDELEKEYGSQAVNA